MIESGVGEFPCVNETDLRRAFEKLQVTVCFVSSS